MICQRGLNFFASLWFRVVWKQQIKTNKNIHYFHQFSVSSDSKLTLMADDLSNYKLQLQQVEVALLTDQDNSELLKLKDDIGKNLVRTK